jgi:hypothetical protein
VNTDKRNALVIAGIGAVALLLILHHHRGAISNMVAGVDPSTLGGSVGPSGVAGINPAELFPTNAGGNTVYPPINIPPIPDFGYNAPSTDTAGNLAKILGALSGVGNREGCCAQAPQTVYMPTTPVFPPTVPTASIPPPIPTYPSAASQPPFQHSLEIDVAAAKATANRTGISTVGSLLNFSHVNLTPTQSGLVSRLGL